MHLGLVMECDYREGATQHEAFDEVFAQVDIAESMGIDGVWLAERHFASPDSGAAIPSIAAAPLIMASAIAARTERLRIGIAVNVLPLSNPVRLAEEAATVDNISHGRLEFVVGRSAFARAYEGFGVPYEQSRERFQECLDIVISAWTNEKFSYEGKYHKFDNVGVVPKPYQKPHPPIRIAAASPGTFPHLGSIGYPIFIGLRDLTLSELAQQVGTYRRAWREAGHPGNGDVLLRMPVYVSKSAELAYSEPKASTMSLFRRLAQTYIRSSEGATDDAARERAERGQRLYEASYDDLLRDRLAHGTPEAVMEQIRHIQDELQLSGVIAEMNTGGTIPREKVLDSLTLFAEKVVPAFR